MKNVYLTVGPGQAYPTLHKHIRTALREEIPSISHRGKVFKKSYQGILEKLRDILKIPLTHHIFFIPNSTEVWKELLQILLKKKVCILLTEDFLKNFIK